MHLKSTLGGHLQKIKYIRQPIYFLQNKEYILWYNHMAFNPCIVLFSGKQEVDLVMQRNFPLNRVIIRSCYGVSHV